MPLDIYEACKLDIVIDTTDLYICSSLSDLNFDSRPKKCKKAKALVPVVSLSYQFGWSIVCY